MDFTSTYHCHTQYSDGVNSPEEMINKAKEIGFTSIGISDHLVLHPTIANIDWAISLNHLDNYVCEIRNLQNNNFDIKLGLEVDFFPENPKNKDLLDIINRYNFDYLIGSIHYIEEFPLDHLKSDWEVLSQAQINKIYMKYWENIKLMAETNLYSIIGHIDLPKKLGFLPNIDLSKYITNALLAIKKNNLTIEINTAGIYKVCKEIYPSDDILNQCKKLKISIMINDDAHSVDELGQYYKELQRMMK